MFNLYNSKVIIKGLRYLLLLLSLFNIRLLYIIIYYLRVVTKQKLKKYTFEILPMRDTETKEDKLHYLFLYNHNIDFENVEMLDTDIRYSKLFFSEMLFIQLHNIAIKKEPILKLP